MNRTAACAQPSAADVERWMPPDVSDGAQRAADAAPRAPSAEEIAAITEAAHRAGAEAGFSEGYAAGHQEGLDKAAEASEAERIEREAREAASEASRERILSESVAALEGIARALADPLASSADDLEPELLALVEALARRVISEELHTRPDLIERVLSQALAQLPSRNHPLYVHVHPDQQAILQAYANSRGESVIWVSDPAIEPGGCIVESGPSRIDASIQARLRQAVDAIWGELARPEPDGGDGLQTAQSPSAPEPPAELASSAAAQSDPVPEPDVSEQAAGATLDAQPEQPVSAPSLPDQSEPNQVAPEENP